MAKPAPRIAPLSLDSETFGSGWSDAGVHIGLDFANTLVTHDEVFRRYARERGLIDETCGAHKQAIRDTIRLLPDGEISWQQLQGQVYGRGIADAEMFDGADGFLRRCRTAGYPVSIVSHKAEFGHHDPERVNLRQSALDWMAACGFFRSDFYGISREDVFLESTRAEKLDKARAAGAPRQRQGVSAWR